MGNARERFRVDGKIALVTGAGSGLGRQFAVALAEAGGYERLRAIALSHLATAAMRARDFEDEPASPTRIQLVYCRRQLYNH